MRANGIDNYKAGLRAADHQFARISGWLNLPMFLVDNVAVTGSTIAAARWGDGMRDGFG
jgi:hypothetical protein